MANAPTYISVDAGNQGTKSLGKIHIATSTTATAEFEFRFDAVDDNNNVITREKALLALESIRTVLESNATYTTEMAQ